MHTAQEITDAIRRLPTKERWNLFHEFADELWSEWDAQIESDLKSGKFDDFLAQAQADAQSPT